MRASDSTMSVALTSMQTAGMTTRAPMTRLTQRSAIRPPQIVPGMPPSDEQEAEDGGGLGLGEAELVLVEARHPRADRGHDEADRRHADQRVAQRRDVHDHPHVAVEPRDHLLGEHLHPVREQRLELLVGDLHLVALRHVRPVGRAAARLGQAPAHPGHDEARDDGDEEGHAPALAVEERAERAADHQARRRGRRS